MGLLDDAIREHLELKRRHGAAPDEVQRQEAEALSRVPRRGDPPPGVTAEEPGAEFAPADVAVPGEESPILEPPPAIPAADQPVMPEPAGHEPVIEDFEASEAPAAVPARPAAADDLWLDDSDEEPPGDVLETPDQATTAFSASDVAAAQAEPVEEDVLEETPDFLQETPEHDRLWFEQRPPRGFDFEQ